MKLKTHKALSKRVKITKTGKAMKRRAGQDHFNTRASGNLTRKKRRDKPLAKAYQKVLRALVPYS